ncbi:MAG TPA: PrsW family glutamic-type intramembrane protease [Bacteroidales bacterium]|nr:PrsW family glutamic-type intramembrane protease [Bacteroidales bacterium]
MNLIVLALAPVFIIAGYIYFRDKYDREPIALLLKSLFLGAIITVPIVLMESVLSVFSPVNTLILKAFYDGFLVAAFTEELWKFAAVYLLIWRNPAFNERFDGIVYAVFVSLGFAGVENLLYVFDGGAGVAFSRAVTAVPAHALFGVTMGYYLAMAKFIPFRKQENLTKALFVPLLFHGFYDFILMTGFNWLLFVFLPFLIYLWITGFKRMKMLSDVSRFNPANRAKSESESLWKFKNNIFTDDEK